MQISIYVINNMPEPGRNLAADACMGRTQLSPCIYNFSTRTIRASRNAVPAWYFFHAEPLISRFSLEKYITLLQQLWQTVLMWNLYPIFISLNQLAVKITPAESFLWMHLHQFQYLYTINDGYSLAKRKSITILNRQQSLCKILMPKFTDGSYSTLGSANYFSNLDGPGQTRPKPTLDPTRLVLTHYNRSHRALMPLLPFLV